jgi:hypothetical protein
MRSPRIGCPCSTSQGPARAAECSLADVSKIHPTALPSTLNMPLANTENPVVSGLI